MRVLIPLYLLILSCTPSLHAKTSESKQWFNAINYSKVNNESRDYESEAHTVASRYYFSPQEHSGVWDDFGYLDTDSNIAINYANDSFSNSNGIFGEGFYGNVFSTLEIANLSETSDYSLGFGYLFGDALKVSVKVQRFDDDSIYLLKGQYNHELNDTDYIGFTAQIDDEADEWLLSSRYFAHLNEGTYFSLDLGYSSDDDDSDFDIMANYYFNRNFAVGVGSNDSDLIVEGKYFINSNYYFTAYYSDYDYNAYNNGHKYGLKIVAQF